jgi:hypothetical protein
MAHVSEGRAGSASVKNEIISFLTLPKARD